MLQKKVLIIDDEEDECTMILAFLRRHHYAADCAHNLKDGMLKLQIMHPDSLLLDNNLPDGFGWKEAPQIQRLYPGMHITLISANGAIPYSITGNGFGFQQMEKPISFKTLEAYL